MKTKHHTKPPSHEGNPSRRSIPIIPSLRASAPPREPFSTPSVFSVHSVVNNSAFSLVELLVVMAIIGMMVGLSALAVSGMRAPALQHAADQVMSGFSLARQLAITKNTEAALLVATNTGANLPSDPYRYWSVVYSNKSAGTWSFAKDWEALPNGAVFLEILRYSDYSRSNAASQPFTNSVGQPFQPTNFVSGNFTIVSGNSTINNNGTFAYSKFNSSGSVGGGLNGPAVIRIVDGTVMNGNVTLTSTNRYYFLEINYMTGRIRMKSRENYINN